MNIYLPFLTVIPLLAAVLFTEADPMATHVDENPPNAQFAEIHKLTLIVPAAAPSARAIYVPPTPTPSPTPTPTATPAPPQRATAEDLSEIPTWTLESIRAYICSYPWPCEEALYVAGTESRFRADVYNYEGSGACGLFQLLPCACIDIECNVGNAYAKWEDQNGIQGDGIGGFERHWYRFWVTP